MYGHRQPRDISVIIPTLNNGKRLSMQLQPLFEQTISQSRYEIIVVNNGSTDATSYILDKLSAQVENLRWVMEFERGRADARNRGIVESQGELIVFLDDDVEVAPDHLERHLDYHTQNAEAMAVIGNVVDISSARPRWLQEYIHSRQDIVSGGYADLDSQIPLGLYFATGNASIPRNTLDLVAVDTQSGKIYFDPLLKRRQDGDLGCRLVKNGIRFIFADDIICYHRHPRNLGDMLQRSYEVGRSTLRLVNKHPEVSGGLKYLTRSHWLNLGLLITCLSLFGPAFLLHIIWKVPLNKVISGLLLYQVNRGFQDALSEYKED
jgi:glycosyltransferase involved in cell wall biosynthesis